MIRQGIDGKISTAQVFPQIIGKEHFLGVTMVLINAVDPIGGAEQNSHQLLGGLWVGNPGAVELLSLFYVGILSMIRKPSS